MGVSLATAEALVDARLGGVSFARTATIGRQAAFVGPSRLARLLRRRGAWPPTLSEDDFRRGFRAAPWTIEPFLRALGAEEIVSIDASPYEGATVVHDLNEPVPERLHGRFSLVFDGGTLEHVFNAPTALRSYMRMVAVGGHLLVLTTADSHFGHGFYQFSPEFFLRALAPENGFEVERLLAFVSEVEGVRMLGLTVPFELRGPAYEVADPAVVRERVQLQSAKPVLLLAQARRTHDAPLLAQPPQQSDYVQAWESAPAAPVEPAAGADAGAGALTRALRRVGDRAPIERRMDLVLDVLPRALPFLSPFAFGRSARRRSLRNRSHFRRVRR